MRDPWTLAAWSVIMLGAAARLARYLDNRSLWGDEAALALNIVYRTFRGLLAPLDYHQSAPLGFLFLERSSLLLLGNNEYALRLVPLLAGLGALPLFYFIVGKFLRRGEALAALSFFAVAEPLVFYSAEVKQYSLEVLVCLVLFGLTLDAARSGADRRSTVLLAIAGLAGMWFSNAVVFLCATASVALIVSAWRRGGSRAALPVLAVPALWGAGLLVQYFLVYRPLMSDERLMVWWAAGYLPFPPRSMADAGKYGRILIGYFADPLGLKAVYVAAALFLAGAAHLLRRDRALLGLAVSPAALAFLASMLGFYPFYTSLNTDITMRTYPFEGRLLLYTVPMAMVIISCGIGFLASGGAVRRLAGIAAAGWIIAVPSYVFARNIFFPPRIQEMRPVMAELDAARRAGDLFLVQAPGAPVFDYYSRRMGWNAAWSEVGFTSMKDANDFIAWIRALPPGTRLWLVTAHHPSWSSADMQRNIAMVLGKLARRAQEISYRNLDAILYVTGPPGASSAIAAAPSIAPPGPGGPE